MKKIVFVALMAIISAASQAQSKSTNKSTYETALGLKVFDGGGVSLKHFFARTKAVELIAFFWNKGTRVTGLYEIHGPVKDVKGLQWYIGPGAHIGFYNSKYGNGAFMGLDGVLGLDYKVNTAPINISIDWQPALEFGTNRGLYAAWGGLGVRYTF